MPLTQQQIDQGCTDLGGRVVCPPPSLRTTTGVQMGFDARQVGLGANPSLFTGILEGVARRGFTGGPTLPDPSGLPSPSGICSIARSLGYQGGCSTTELIAAGLGHLLGFTGNGGAKGGTECPDPLVFDPQLESCIFPGSPGDISVTDVTDVPSAIGPLGLSTEPIVVGEINGKPIRRCPNSMLVLAKDNRCYSKRDLPVKFRKWRPHKCSSPTDRRLKQIKAAGTAAKSLKKAFKGSGYKVVKS